MGDWGFGATGGAGWGGEVVGWFGGGDGVFGDAVEGFEVGAGAWDGEGVVCGWGWETRHFVVGLGSGI